jgi:hypothetical protein
LIYLQANSRTLYKAAELTFTDSDIVLIAYLSDLDHFHIESFRQFKSLGAGYLFSAIRHSFAFGGFENGVN